MYLLFLAVEEAQEENEMRVKNTPTCPIFPTAITSS